MAVEEIDIVTFAGRHGEGVTVIDVRNPDEYQTAHVPGARLMPLPELPELIDEIPGNDVVYLICATGGRSERATEFLMSQGYEAVNVVGGTKAWIGAGNAVDSGA